MYEIKANFGANLFFSLDEIVFQLKSDYDFTATNEEILKVIQDDKVIFLLSFQDIIKKIELLRGITITKDNIHLYYEFMSDEDLKAHRFELTFIYNSRLHTIFHYFNTKCNFIGNRQDFRKLYTLDNLQSGYITSWSIFGVQDTLKPINEYIEEIKASSEYKEYI